MKKLLLLYSLLLSVLGFSIVGQDTDVSNQSFCLSFGSADFNQFCSLLRGVIVAKNCIEQLNNALQQIINQENGAIERRVSEQTTRLLRSIHEIILSVEQAEDDVKKFVHDIIRSLLYEYTNITNDINKIQNSLSEQTKDAINDLRNIDQLLVQKSSELTFALADVQESIVTAILVSYTRVTQTFIESNALLTEQIFQIINANDGLLDEQVAYAIQKIVLLLRERVSQLQSQLACIYTMLKSQIDQLDIETQDVLRIEFDDIEVKIAQQADGHITQISNTDAQVNDQSNRIILLLIELMNEQIEWQQRQRTCLASVQADLCDILCIKVNSMNQSIQQGQEEILSLLQSIESNLLVSINREYEIFTQQLIKSFNMLKECIASVNIAIQEQLSETVNYSLKVIHNGAALLNDRIGNLEKSVVVKNSEIVQSLQKIDETISQMIQTKLSAIQSQVTRDNNDLSKDIVLLQSSLQQQICSEIQTMQKIITEQQIQISDKLMMLTVINGDAKNALLCTMAQTESSLCTKIAQIEAGIEGQINDQINNTLRNLTLKRDDIFNKLQNTKYDIHAIFANEIEQHDITMTSQNNMICSKLMAVEMQLEEAFESMSERINMFVEDVQEDIESAKEELVSAIELRQTAIDVILLAMAALGIEIGLAFTVRLETSVCFCL